MRTTNEAVGRDEPNGVVIPASRYPHGYASVRSLTRADIRTIVAVADKHLPVAASRFCDEVVRVPPSYEILAYKDALLGIAARSDVYTIIPHRPQDTYVLSKYHDEFDQYVSLVVPPLETLKRVHDRKQLMDIAERTEVPVPETRLLDEATEWDVDRVVKSRYNLLVDEYIDSYEPSESSIVKSVQHVPSNESLNIATTCEAMDHVPIVQEYIDGTDEYVFGALYDHGEPLATFQHRQIRGDSYTGGGGVYRESVEIPSLEAVGRAVLDELEWHGLACIEYIEDAATGEFKLVEINPRMWQSLACAAASGADFPYWYWLQVIGNSDSIEPGYEVGVGTHYMIGELEYLTSIVRDDSSIVGRPPLSAAIKEVLLSCFEMPNFDYCHVDDPLPTVRLARSEVSHGIRRRMT
ncbi:carboxylate--amine ligase [Haladaptatus pallidirubidus]|uniref:ATP-grasp domain-containing protein n=2 Tax=Haladaptatus pallidirubidus TaxID=1008152 RepID=A0AAV3UIQ5_9EURY|nr:carboxylate--amine ligase [Haladaptatus pallidirubidus]